MAKYATVANVKDAIKKLASDDDGIIEKWLKGIEAAVDTWCNRPDGFVALATATERLFPGSGYPYMTINECVEIVLVSVKDSITDSTYTAWIASDWIAFSGSHDEPDFNRLPYNGIMVDPSGSYDEFTSGTWIGRSGFPRSTSADRKIPTVKVSAKWGYAVSVPDDIAISVIALTEMMYKQGESGFADNLTTAELGALRFIQRNPFVRGLLGPYRIPAVG